MYLARLWENFTSILEGIALFVMILFVAIYALFAWPIHEIWDTWTLRDKP